MQSAYLLPETTAPLLQVALRSGNHPETQPARRVLAQEKKSDSRRGLFSASFNAAFWLELGL